MNTLRGTLVVGVDESALAGQAVRWAAEQAALERRSLRLCAARTGPYRRGGASTRASSSPGRSPRCGCTARRCSRQAHELAHRVAPDVEIEEQLEVTTPRALLLDVADAAHLVVLGSRGRGPAT